MPAQPPDKSAELAKQLGADPKREATASQRGYDWQRWLTIQKWIELQGEDDLWIEFGEDVTTVTVDGIETVQAKDRDGTVSLGVAHVRQMIEVAFNRATTVRTILWTTSRVTLEQKKHFRDVPGIRYWASVQEGTAPLQPLREFLESSLSTDTADKVKGLSDEALLTAVKNVQFVTDEVDMEGLKRRVLGKLEPRLTSLGIKNASLQREYYGRALFEFVSRKSANAREGRRLDRIMLDQEVLGTLRNLTLANLPSGLDQTVQVVQQFEAKLDDLIDRKSARLGPAAQAAIAAALERDLRSKYDERMARSLFDEAQPADELSSLGEEVLTGQYDTVPDSLRQDILLRASRSSSVRDKLDDARKFLSAAQALDGKRSFGPAQARLLAAEGKPDAAIEQLTDHLDDESYSTLLSILLREKGAASAVEYHRNTGRNDLLTASGLTTIAVALIEIDERPAALTLLEGLPEELLDKNPMVALRRGLLQFASIFEDEVQVGILAGIPMDARAQPNVPHEKRRKSLDSAIGDFRRVKDAAQKLGLPRAVAIASSYETWAELLHPDRSGDALTRLRSDISNVTSHGLLAVQFAFAFDDSFAPAALRDHLMKKAAAEGLSDDEFRAIVSIALHVDSAADMATFVAQYREKLSKEYGEPGTLQIEIQALARSGDVRRARELLQASADRVNPDAKPFLEAVVSAAEGKDPVEAHTTAYEQKPSNEALRTLLRVLHTAQRWETFAQRAEELFGRTGILEELADAARAYMRLRDDANFLRLIEAHPDLQGLEPAFGRQTGWAHFRLGQLNEARKAASQRAPSDRDLDLEIAVALESGDWENIPAIISAYLDVGSNHPAHDVIRAARLAQIVGQGPLLELVDRAVELGPEDPDVLLAAYTLVLEEGLEDDRPQSAEWFRVALSKSGDDGPVRHIDLKELVALGRSSSESGMKISEAVMEGSLPMLAAAQGLGGTQLQVTLGNLVGNSYLADARNKIPVNLFSGRRGPTTLNVKVLGLDISALMTLAWLGLLPTLATTYKEVHIPAGVMMELFDGQRRIREQQKSRLRHAREIHEAVKGNRLKVVKVSHHNDVLDREVGSDLADLLRSAQVNKGAVIRPSPVHKVGEFEGNADVGSFGALLSDIPTLIDFLISDSRLDQEQEQVARDQSGPRQDGWPSPAPLAADAPLYLDGLSTECLQQARILGPVLETFAEVFISEHDARAAQRTVEQEQVTNEMLSIVASLRTFVAKGLRSGAVKSGKYHDAWSVSTPGERPSALNLIADIGDVEAVIFDDRAINKDGFVADNHGRRVPLGSSLDVIEDLLVLGAITKTRKSQLRMRLRKGGAILVPLEVDELVDAVRRNQASASPEFRAIQQSLDMVRLVEAPVFPADIPWFAGSISAIKNAVHAVWRDKKELKRSGVWSDQLVGIYMAPDDWQFGWKDAPPPQWADTVSGALLAGLAFPVSITDKEIKKAFDDWVEQNVLQPLSENESARYDWLVRYLIDLIDSGTAWDDN